MSLVKWGFIGLILLPVAEIAAFVVMALVIGWFWAGCLFLATSLLGVLILRQSGKRDIERFRAAFAEDGIAAIKLDSPGLGRIIGGILLVFPGFISDLAGALLLVPAVRRWIRSRFGQALEFRRRNRDPSVIDLTPDEWHQISDNTPTEDASRRRRKRVR